VVVAVDVEAVVVVAQVAAAQVALAARTAPDLD
jgi:hypothetical protein